MYNRYIPQKDGSYRRSYVPEPQPPQRPQPEPEPRPESPPCAQEEGGCPQGLPCAYREPPRPIPPRPKAPPVSVGSFLKQLIPAGFDTEDLMVVLLLLLMAGDCREDQNRALLTLALYLFL